ncbi:MAG: DUF948 domain-containing protein [Actinomycetota bacterium]
MNGTEIASLIAAGGFVVLVLFLAIPILKLGKLIDRSSESVSKMTDELTPLVSEMTVTLEEANRQLKKIDSITSDVSQVTTNLSSLVAVFTSSLGGPLAKLAGLGGVLKRFLGKR